MFVCKPDKRVARHVKNKKIPRRNLAAAAGSGAFLQLAVFIRPGTSLPKPHSNRACGMFTSYFARRGASDVEYRSGNTRGAPGAPVGEVMRGTSRLRNKKKKNQTAEKYSCPTPDKVPRNDVMLPCLHFCLPAIVCTNPLFPFWALSSGSTVPFALLRESRRNSPVRQPRHNAPASQPPLILSRFPVS